MIDHPDNRTAAGRAGKNAKNAEFRAGYAALLGRPNVGKSTLLNRLLAQKISITSAKPQTTRHAILGIKTRPDAQIVYVDTPGLHLDRKRAINRYMNRAADSTLGYVDVAVLLVEALRWTFEDDDALRRLANFTGPTLLAINKIDRIDDKKRLLPFIQETENRRGANKFSAVIPLSALKRDNLDRLERLIIDYLPSGDALFDPDQVTTLSQRFLAAELIREKLIRLLREELPYSLTVEIEHFQEDGRQLRIHAVVWVERPGQKAIVIGRQGVTLKTAGQQARIELEKLLQRPVFLQTWVKVRAGWSDDERALQHFGYRHDT